MFVPNFKSERFEFSSWRAKAEERNDLGQAAQGQIGRFEGLNFHFTFSPFVATHLVEVEGTFLR